MKSTLKPVLTMALAALMMAGALGQMAQANADPITPEAQRAIWKENVVRQLTFSLESNSPGIRAETIQVVIDLANQVEDLEPVVPALLGIYEWDTETSHRMLALAALHAIGNEKGLERVAEIVEKERSPFVRRATLASLGARLHSN